MSLTGEFFFTSSWFVLDMLINISDFGVSRKLATDLICYSEVNGITSQIIFRNNTLYQVILCMTCKSAFLSDPPRYAD